MTDLCIMMHFFVFALVTVQCFHPSSNPPVSSTSTSFNLQNTLQDDYMNLKLQGILHRLKERSEREESNKRLSLKREFLRLYESKDVKQKSASERKSRPAGEKKSLNDELRFPLIYKRFGQCLDFPMYSPKPVYMVTKCPHHSSNKQAEHLCHGNYKMLQEERHKCVIDLQQIPVQDLDGTVYKNIYCSQCHGAHNVSFWTADLTFINDIPVLKLMDGFINTSINFLKNMDEMAMCSKKIFPYNQNVIKHCHNPIHDHFHEHRARNVPTHAKPNVETKIPLSFQILINFGINGEGHIIFSTETSHPVETVSCPPNQVYYNSHCREVSCDEGYHLENDVCQPDPITLNSNNSLLQLQNAKEMLSLTFRLNASKEDLLILEQDNAEAMLIEEIAFVLNVSSTRIRNVRIVIRNGTTQSQMLEIAHPHLFRDTRDFDENERSSPEILTNKFLFRNDTSGGSYTAEELDNEALYTVEIKFDLLENMKKAGKFSSSLTSVVDNMNYLIRTKSFNLELNGSDFKITEIKHQQNNVSHHLITWCNHGTKKMMKGNQVDIMNSTDTRTGRIIQGVFVNETGKFYGPDMYDFYIYIVGEFGNINNVTVNALVFLCDTPRIQNGECAKLTLNSTSYEKLSNNSVFYEGEVFDSDRYEYVDDTHAEIRICIYSQGVSSSILKTSCGVEFQDVIVAESYLSFVLGIISIVITFLSLITYLIFKQMRNLPGVSTANLTFALFLAELLFIVSGVPKPDWMCSVIGMMLHYLFLSSFFWMNVMSYDLYKTFANKCILTRVRSKEKYLPRYALYAWGSPALIVAICAVIDYTDLLPYVKIKYGGGSLSSNGFVDHGLSDTWDNASLSQRMESMEENLGCWIQEPVAALVAFGSPMLLILFSNSVMFVRTIYCIRKTLKLANIKTRRSSLNHVTGKSDVRLYVRMSTMMGFTWISGLASSIVSAFATTPTFTICTVLHVLSFLFIIFNCSQGLFIFFAFICNRRVGNYYKAMFLNCKSKITGENVLKSSRISVSTLTSWTYTFEVVQITENKKY
jgi:hypothetical protein